MSTLSNTMNHMVLEFNKSREEISSKESLLERIGVEMSTLSNTMTQIFTEFQKSQEDMSSKHTEVFIRKEKLLDVLNGTRSQYKEEPNNTDTGATQGI